MSRSKCVSLKQVSCFTTMYEVKWWHALETCGMTLVSSACHHFTTYIVVKHDTCFKCMPSFYYIHYSERWHLFQWHTFRSRQALKHASTCTTYKSLQGMPCNAYSPYKADWTELSASLFHWLREKCRDNQLNHLVHLSSFNIWAP